MAEMPNVATLTTISSDWGNDIRDRTVQRYTSVSNRTTEHPSPAEGDLSYLEDSNTVWVYDGAGWVAGLPDGAVTTAKLADDAVTAAKLASNAVVEASIVDTVVTPSKLNFSVAQNLMSANGNANTSNSALSASFVDKATVSFTKPAAWTTFRIIAWGSAIMGGLSAGAVVEARVEIGGSNGSTFSFGSGSSTPEQSVGCFHVADGSTNLTIATACRAASGSGNHLNSYVAYTAYRLT